MVADDFSSGAVDWSMLLINTRGRCVVEMAARTDLHTLIVGNVTILVAPDKENRSRTYLFF